MLYTIIQLFTKESRPMIWNRNKITSLKAQAVEITEPYIYPIGIIMYGETPADDSIYFRILDVSSSFFWKSCLAQVKNKTELDDALKLSTLFPELSYSIEVIPCIGDPIELSDYKFDNVLIDYDQMMQKIYRETSSQN